jgi:DNA-binding transcriptional regulator YiaG
MWGTKIKEMRKNLRLSRAELARFLGVSDATVVRWEANDAISEPRGLQMVLLRAMDNAQQHLQPRDVARTIRSSSFNHAEAIKQLLDAGR